MVSASKEQVNLDSTLKSILHINQHLKSEHFCCPLYGSITGKWVSDAYKIIKSTEPERLKYHVTSEVIHPSRRAYQTVHFYHQLEIFKPFSYVIDAASVSYLEGNVICAYLSLAPVIEGVLKKWNEEIKNKERIKQGERDVIRYIISKLSDEDLLHQCIKIAAKFADDFYNNVFFENGEIAKKKEGKIINRHVASHMLKPPRYLDSLINTPTLFLFLDIIGDLYLHTHFDEYPDLHGCFVGKIAYPDKMDNYFDLFKRCAITGQENSNLNRLHNVCYGGKITF